MVSPTISVGPSGVITLPLGKRRSSAATSAVPSGRDVYQHGGPGRLAGHQVEAEVAHVGVAVAVDHHVVGQAAAVLGDVGVDRDRAVGRPPQHLLVAHRHHEQRPVGQPAEARGLGLDGQHLLGGAAGGDGEHRVAVEVGHPPAAVVPAWALEERAPVGQRLERVVSHAGNVLHPARQGAAGDHRWSASGLAGSRPRPASMTRDGLRDVGWGSPSDLDVMAPR